MNRKPPTPAPTTATTPTIAAIMSVFPPPPGEVAACADGWGSDGPACGAAGADVGAEAVNGAGTVIWFWQPGQAMACPIQLSSTVMCCSQ